MVRVEGDAMLAEDLLNHDARHAATRPAPRCVPGWRRSNAIIRARCLIWQRTHSGNIVRPAALAWPVAASFISCDWRPEGGALHSAGVTRHPGPKLAGGAGHPGPASGLAVDAKPRSPLPCPAATRRRRVVAGPMIRRGRSEARR